MDERLLEFAQQGAAREHNYYTEGIETLESGGHKGEFKNCPHPDCQLVRALPAEDRAVTQHAEARALIRRWTAEDAALTAEDRALQWCGEHHLLNCPHDHAPDRAVTAPQEPELVDALVRGHGDGQEHTIADVNAGRIDDLIAPRLERERERYSRELDEREAACCPEDVGFEEWIRVLTSQRDEAQKAAAQWRDGLAAAKVKLAALTHAIEALREEMEQKASSLMYCIGDESKLQRETIQKWAAILKEWEGRQ